MKTIKLLILSIIIPLGFLSCSNEDLNPLPKIETRVGLVTGKLLLPVTPNNNVRATPDYDTDPPQIGVDDALISIEIETPQDNVDSYTLMAKISGMDGIGTPTGYSEYTPIITITEFPTTISVSLTELAAAFGLTANDFSLSPTTSPQHLYIMGTTISNGITVNLDNVTGAGFSEADNPDGISSGLTNLYQESKHYVVRYYP